MDNELKKVTSGRDRARGMVRAARALLHESNPDVGAADHLLAIALQNLQPIKRNRRGAQVVEQVEVLGKVPAKRRAKKASGKTTARGTKRLTKSERSERAKKAWKTRKRNAKHAA